MRVFVGPVIDWTSLASVSNKTSHPAGLPGRLAKKGIIVAPALGAGVARHTWFLFSLKRQSNRL